MELKNYEILNANMALGELVNEKITGAFKFKLYKAKSELEKAVEVVSKSLEGVINEEEQQEILKETQELNFAEFTQSDLEPLPLSMKQLASLDPITEKGE